MDLTAGATEKESSSEHGGGVGLFERDLSKKYVNNEHQDVIYGLACIRAKEEHAWTVVVGERIRCSNA
jgi:hypothetical protein